MSDSPEQPDQPAQPEPEITPVTATRQEGAPPIIPAPPEMIEGQPVVTPPIECEAIPTKAEFSEELRAAKWYSIGFLAVISVLTLIGLIVMVWITLRFFDSVTQ
ncbi:MAG TPA: hypothetical protein VHD56_06465 [Tepidisphaeraceae bacterium]|nr:hypothetical protein [Tepidisphaeraceae bacterium]